jgi:hypothetical protein
MALLECPECGKMFSEYAEHCPECGCPTKDAIAANVVNASLIPQPTEEVGSNEQAPSIIGEKSVESETEMQQGFQPSTENDESNIEVQKTIRKWLWCVGIMAVLIAVFIIVYNSFDPQKDDDRTTQEVTTQIESSKEIEGNTFTEPRTYYRKDIWVEEMDDGDGNASNVEASESVTIKFTTQHTVRIELEQQDIFVWEGTYSIGGQTVTMKVQNMYDSEMKAVITAKLEGEKLIIGENTLCIPRELERSDVSGQSK